MGNSVDGDLNKRAVYTQIVPKGNDVLPKLLPEGNQWLMRFYLESFQLQQLYCQEFGQAEGWLSIRLKFLRLTGLLEHSDGRLAIFLETVAMN